MPLVARLECAGVCVWVVLLEVVALDPRFRFEGPLPHQKWTPRINSEHRGSSRHLRNLEFERIPAIPEGEVM